MTMKISTLLFFAAFALPLPAIGADLRQTFSLDRIIELATSNAPEARLAATNIAEEEARLAGAQVLAMQNPKLETALGPRTGSGTGVDAEIALEVPLEFGRRDKRIAVARAGIEREKHAAQDVRRLAVAAAVSAYYRLLQAQEGLKIVQERSVLAGELQRVATERYESGDGPKFDVNLARGEVIRAGSEISAAKAHVAAAQGALAQSLGLPSAGDLLVTGDIRDRKLFDTIDRQEAPRDRADHLAALADVEASNAALSLAQAEAESDWAVRMAYRREGDENITTAAVSVTLPFVNRNQGAIGQARVRTERARLAAEARKASIESEIEAARRTYHAAIEAVLRLENEGLPLQRETESMATESYRSGKINLATLLQVRRDALETRKEYLERLLEAAEAGVKLATAVGTFTVSR